MPMEMYLRVNEACVGIGIDGTDGVVEGTVIADVVYILIRWS